MNTKPLMNIDTHENVQRSELCLRLSLTVQHPVARLYVWDFFSQCVKSCLKLIAWWSLSAEVLNPHLVALAVTSLYYLIFYK